MGASRTTTIPAREDVRGGRQNVPTGRFTRVRGDQRGESIEVRQQHRDAQAPQRRSAARSIRRRGSANPAGSPMPWHCRAGAPRRFRRPSAGLDAGGARSPDHGHWVKRRVASIRPGAGKVAAGAEPEHEHRDDQGRRVHGVSEHVAEDTDPDDLIDQAAQARAEEQEIQEASHGGMGDESE